MNAAQLSLLAPVPSAAPENTDSAGAILSACGLFRYLLWRCWDPAKPWIVYLMHNPSEADALKADPTLRICIRLARLWGFGGLWILNLYGFRSAKPPVLLKCVDPIGPDNDRTLREYVSRAPTVVCAWGADPDRARPGRVREVMKILDELGVKPQVISLAKNLHPVHPRATAYFENQTNIGKRLWLPSERAALLKRIA